MMFLTLAVALLSPQDSKQKPVDPPALVEVFRFSERGVVGLDFAPTGTTLAVGGDGYVGMIDLQTFKVVKQVAQKDLVDEVLFDPSGMRLISRSKRPDTVFRLPGDLESIEFKVDMLDSGTPVDPTESQVPTHSTYTPPDFGITGSCPAAFSKDGRRLALVNGQRGFRVWGLDGPNGLDSQMRFRGLNFESLPVRMPKNAGEGDFRRTIGIPLITLNHATALGYEGDCLWVGMEDGFVMPVDPYWFKSLGEPKQDQIPPAVFAGVKIEYVTPKNAGVFRPHAADVTSIVFLDGGRTLMTAGREGSVGIWNTRAVLDRKPPVKGAPPPREPRPLKVLPGHFACPSPDGKFIAVAEKYGVRCYDRESFTPVSWTPTDRRLGTPSRVKFSRDGSMLAATICACATCSKADVIYTQAAFPKMRSHHHGGTLIVWSTITTATPAK